SAFRHRGAGHHRHRGQGLRAAEGPYRAVPRCRIRGGLPAQGEDRSGDRRRSGRPRDRCGRSGRPHRQDRRRQGLCLRPGAGRAHPHRRNRQGSPLAQSTMKEMNMRKLLPSLVLALGLLIGGVALAQAPAATAPAATAPAAVAPAAAPETSTPATTGTAAAAPVAPAATAQAAAPAPAASGAPAAPAPVPNKGDTAWMTVATVLVILMTIPGLALFYGGLVRSKNMLSVLMQVFVVTAMIYVLWALYGYSVAFTAGNPFVGSFDKLFLKGVTPDSVAATFSKGVVIPELSYFTFQATFAAITCALIVGSFAERIKFS